MKLRVLINKTVYQQKKKKNTIFRAELYFPRSVFPSFILFTADLTTTDALIPSLFITSLRSWFAYLALFNLISFITSLRVIFYAALYLAIVVSSSCTLPFDYSFHYWIYFCSKRYAALYYLTSTIAFKGFVTL